MARKATAYDRAYEATPEQKKNRAQRNAARREYEKKHGALPKGTEVDHILSISRGGSNKASNLQAISRRANRSKK